MTPQYIHDTVRKLQRTRLRGLLAAGASVYQTVRRHRVHAFFTDADGDWVNWQRDATFVCPDLYTADARSVEQLVLDQWGYGYVPRPGDVVFDVGAGIGEETIVFSRLVGPTGRVIAIEAHPRTFGCLAKTVRRNGLTNVTLLNCAISNTDQDVAITDTDQHLANTIVGVGGITVRGRRMDALLDELGIQRIDLLKMNIEGAERLAIEGMARAILQTRFACISCHDFIADAGGPETSRSRDAVQAFLEVHGFEIARRVHDARPWVRDYLYATNPRLPAGKYS